MKKTVFVAFATLTILSACQKRDVPIPNDTFNNPLRSAMDSAVHKAFLMHQNELGTEGVSIGILKDDVVHFYGYGETRNGNGIAPDKNTYFEIGSISKTFTAIAVMNMLLDQNKTIETPIRLYLPADLPTLQREQTEVNFKHVLTHTAGLPYFPDNFSFSIYTGNVDGVFANYDSNKLFTAVKNMRLRSKPFTRFEYSNTGFALMGHILGAHYNKNYGAILKEKILSPLSLTATSAYFEETDVNNWAVGYNQNGEEEPYWKTINAFDGAGVIKSNAAEMLKYAQANITPPLSTLGKAINLTHNQTFLSPNNSTDGSISGGLGWFLYRINELPNDTFLWHNGGTGGFNSELFINKAKKTALVMLYNTAADAPAREKLKLSLLKLLAN